MDVYYVYMYCAGAHSPGATGQGAWAAARLQVDLLLKLAWAHDVLSQSRTKFVKAPGGGGKRRGGHASGPINGTRGSHELRQTNAGSKIRVGSRENAQRHLAAAAHSANSANSANAGPKARVGSRENAQRHQERALECYGRALDLISSVNATDQERAAAGAAHPATSEDSANSVNTTNAAVGRGMDEERAVCWYLRAQLLEHRISGDRLTNLLASVGAYREADHGEGNLKSSLHCALFSRYTSRLTLKNVGQGVRQCSLLEWGVLQQHWGLALFAASRLWRKRVQVT